jgi:HD superfamily phosphodiesterase
VQAKIRQLITEAEDILSKKPFDAAHGLEHHQQVWKNAQKIIDGADEQVDLVALQIAAMWHDVVFNKKIFGKKLGKRRTANYIAQKMKKLGFAKSTIRKTKIAILQHSVMNRQTILESKILADADLLEWFNPQRFEHFLKIYTTGKSRFIKKKALKLFAHKWLKRLPSLIHFPTTKKSFYQKITNFKKNKTILQLIKEQGEDLDNYLKALQ